MILNKYIIIKFSSLHNQKGIFNLHLVLILRSTRRCLLPAVKCKKMYKINVLSAHYSSEIKSLPKRDVNPLRTCRAISPCPDNWIPLVRNLILLGVDDYRPLVTRAPLFGCWSAGTLRRNRSCAYWHRNHRAQLLIYFKMFISNFCFKKLRGNSLCTTYAPSCVAKSKATGNLPWNTSCFNCR